MADILESSEYHAVCIAKDEEAYIHEWIFHHLNFGFDKVFIYLNRITDQSELILESISEKYPNVIFETVDWVDWCQSSVKKSIQDIVYAYHFSKVKRLQKEIYTLFIDADEYWTPIDFVSTIDAEHDAIGRPAMVSYEWLLESGRKEEFSRIQSPLFYRYCSLVKTLYKNELTPNLFSAHKALIKGGYKGTTADGQPFIAHDIRKQGRVNAKEACLKRSFIIHRVMKSETEYLCSLIRSNPDSDSSIKLNRNGYYRARPTDDTLDFSPSIMKEYDKRLSEFIVDCGIEDKLHNIRNKRYIKICVLLRKVYEMDSSFNVKLSAVFRNISNEFVKCLMEYRLEKDKSPEERKKPLYVYLRDLAVSVEKHDLETARFFMNEARRLSPKGPFIINKLKHYDDLLLS